MEIGKKIKDRRILLGLTQEELANRCELTKGYISQLENDKTDPSIVTLKVILDVLGVSLSDFFKAAAAPKITYSEEEQLDKHFDGYTQSWLVTSAQNLMMEPIYIVLNPGAETTPDFPHIGEEFGYVIEGEIDIYYDDYIVRCKTGESFYFKADKTHYLKNIGSKTAKVIWVSTPPNF